MRNQDRSGYLWACTVLVGVLACLSCSSDPPPTTISLVERFDAERVENAVEPEAPEQTFEWRFDQPADGDGPLRGWRALRDTEGLGVRDGRLVGTSTGSPVLVVAAPDELDRSDQLHSLEIRLEVSEGARLSVVFSADEELDEEALLERLANQPLGDIGTELITGDDVQTYTLTTANTTVQPSFPLAGIRHIALLPTDAAGSSFELESMRLVPLKEHLASVPSGVGWRGLAEIYRETLVARVPETISFAVDLPSRPFLEVALGTIEDGPVTFAIEARRGGSKEPVSLLRRTVSTRDRWESVAVDLEDLAGETVDLVLSLAAESEGRIGYWGGPAIHSRGARGGSGQPSQARSALGEDGLRPPQGVIFIVADTLRRDHLEAYGHSRANAPLLSRLAEEGALFEDTIAQGTWTKVSVSSILTSLYPSTHGLQDMPDRISAAITTAAEAFRGAGYATFATSSIPFTGKLSNLHQGVDVLHERASLVAAADLFTAKTAKGFVDRLLPWLEQHRDVPFFAFLHVFDPHSPFEPEAPWNTLWMSEEDAAAHRAEIEKVGEFIENPFFKPQGLPTQEQIDKTDVDQARYVEREKIWYDASIRAMDVEISRIVERLDELGLSKDTLIVFMSDHGEEFLEHGRHFHGYSAYGEMLNVPLVLWWPGVVPAGARVSATVQAIDVLPTVLDLAGIPAPAEAQGQSLLPLLAEGQRPEDLGWRRRPAFAERFHAPAAFTDDDAPIEAIVVVDEGWKLIKNLALPEGRPEFELYDHENDPINMTNLADENPEVVERLARIVEGWHESAKAAHIAPDEAGEGLSAEELQQLRSLGYVQ